MPHIGQDFLDECMTLNPCNSARSYNFEFQLK